MHVKREAISKETMVSSGGRERFCIFFMKSTEVWMCCGVLPTRVDKMPARNLAMLYVTELMLLTMGLSGAPSSWILRSL